MEPSDAVSTVAVIVVALVLVGSGPLAGGFVQPSGTPTTIDDGDAEVATVDIATSAFALSPGRFGTDVTYLRLPDATVELATVTDHPRLVYRVNIPALGVDRTVNKIVSDRGHHRLHLRDYALEPGTVEAGQYEATIRVRVQSFSADRTVYRRNVTVEVVR